MDVFRRGDGWWLAIREGPGRDEGGQPGEERGPFGERPSPLSRWAHARPEVAPRHVAMEERTFWGTTEAGAAISSRMVWRAAEENGEQAEAEAWAPGAHGPGRRARPPTPPGAGDPAGAGDGFRWDEGRGWILLPRAHTLGMAGPDAGQPPEWGGPPQGLAAARALVRDTPHLASPGALMAAGFLDDRLEARKRASIARWLERAWAEALGEDAP